MEYLKIKKTCSFLFIIIIITLVSLIQIQALIIQGNMQNCGFRMDMGENYSKCKAVCQGRSAKCIAHGTCLCQTCPNSMGYGNANTHEDVSCEFTQECSRKCMEAASEPEFDGNLGRGKMCKFVDENYGMESSVCVCTCI